MARRKAVWPLFGMGMGVQEKEDAQSDLVAISVEGAMEVEGRGGIGKAVWPLYGWRRCCRGRRRRKAIWPQYQWRGDEGGRTRRNRQSGLAAIWVDEVLQERTLFCISARAEAASSLGAEAPCGRVGAPDTRRASGMGLTRTVLLLLLLLPPFLPPLILLPSPSSRSSSSSAASSSSVPSINHHT